MADKPLIYPPNRLILQWLATRRVAQRSTSLRSPHQSFTELLIIVLASLDPELPSRDGYRQPIQGMAVASGAPGMSELVAVAVELDAVGGGPDFAPAEQELERLTGGHAGAELAGHDGGGALAGLEIDPALVRQIVPVEQRGGQTDQETDGLFMFGSARHLEIVLEAHATGEEIEQGGAHT